MLTVCIYRFLTHSWVRTSQWIYPSSMGKNQHDQCLIRNKTVRHLLYEWDWSLWFSTFPWNSKHVDLKCKADSTVATSHIENMSHRLPIFIPFASLTQSVIKSIVTVATTFRKPNFDYSQRTILIFLLEIHQQLTEIEKKIRDGSTEVDPQLMDQAKNVRQWLVTGDKQPLNWRELRSKYNGVANKNCDAMARYYRSSSAEPYFELKIETVSDSRDGSWTSFRFVAIYGCAAITRIHGKISKRWLSFRRTQALLESETDWDALSRLEWKNSVRSIRQRCCWQSSPISGQWAEPSWSNNLRDQWHRKSCFWCTGRCSNYSLEFRSKHVWSVFPECSPSCLFRRTNNHPVVAIWGMHVRVRIGRVLLHLFLSQERKRKCFCTIRMLTERYWIWSMDVCRVDTLYRSLG